MLFPVLFFLLLVCSLMMICEYFDAFVVQEF